MTDEPDTTEAHPRGEAPGLAVSVEEAPFTANTIRAIANTDFVPRALRGKPAAILAAVLTGRELGLGPMESLRQIDVIDGRPSPSAEWMVGRILGAGHRLEVNEQTATSCTVTGTRYDERGVVFSMSFTFTTEMAGRVTTNRDGTKTLLDKANWKNYPEAMLYWRAVSQLARQFFPDCLSGLKYLPDELGDGSWVEEPPSLSGSPEPAEVEVVGEEEAGVEAAPVEQEEGAEVVSLPARAAAEVDEAAAEMDRELFDQLITELGWVEGIGAEDGIEGVTFWREQRIKCKGECVGRDALSGLPPCCLDARVRRLYQLAEEAGVVQRVGEMDPLHFALRQNFGAQHVGDLSPKAKLVTFIEQTHVALDRMIVKATMT